MSDGKLIDSLIMCEMYDEAIVLLRRELRQDKDNHWLLAELSTCYHEKREYEKSLECIERAMGIEPECPLVLWHYAGALSSCERDSAALVIYMSLINRGVKKIAYGKCGEGLEAARSLVNDCRYRVGCIYYDQRNLTEAAKWFSEHLENRPKADSIYNKRHVKGYLRRCTRAKLKELKKP